MTGTYIQRFISEELQSQIRDSEAKGEARGKAEGKAEDVLSVLDTRGIAIPDQVRADILACTSPATLDTYLRRAVTAATAAEVTAPITAG